VVAAAGAPADLLVGGVLLGGLRLVGGRHPLDAGAEPGEGELGGGGAGGRGHETVSSAEDDTGRSVDRSTWMPSASATRPPMASTRYFARSSIRSGPRFISGTSTLS